MLSKFVLHINIIISNSERDCKKKIYREYTNSNVDDLPRIQLGKNLVLIR